MSQFPVAISSEALLQILKLRERKGATGPVRIGVKGGGCSGLEYALKLEDSQKEEDLVVVLDNVIFVCDPKSAQFLEGSLLLYSGNLVSGGFQFENPNAKRSCGCGTSFTPKDVH